MQTQSEQPASQHDIILAYTRLLATNKITSKNCFELNLDHVSQLEQFSQIDAGENWMKVATHMNSESKIFSMKVDTLHEDTTKVVNELSRTIIDNGIRRQPTNHQLKGVREQINRKTSGWASINANLDSNIDENNLQRNQTSITFFDTKKLLVDSLKLQLDLSLTAGNSLSDFKPPFPSTINLNFGDFYSIRQLSLFSEFLSFRSDLDEFAESLQLSSNKEASRKEQMLDREMILDIYDRGLLTNQGASKQQDEFKDQSTFMGLGQSTIIESESSVKNQHSFFLSGIPENEQILASSHKITQWKSLSDILDPQKGNKKINKKPKGPRKKKAIDSFCTHFNSDTLLTRQLLQRIKVKRFLEDIEFPQSNLIPMTLCFEVQFKSTTNQNQIQPIETFEPIQQLQSMFDSRAEPKSKCKRNHLTINSLKQQIWKIIKDKKCQTDLKTVFGPLHSNGVDIPFLWSALLHVAVERQLVLTGDAPNFKIDMV